MCVKIHTLFVMYMCIITYVSYGQSDGNYSRFVQLPTSGIMTHCVQLSMQTWGYFLHLQNDVKLSGEQIKLCRTIYNRLQLLDYNTQMLMQQKQTVSWKDCCVYLLRIITITYAIHQKLLPYNAAHKHAFLLTTIANRLRTYNHNF